MFIYLVDKKIIIYIYVLHRRWEKKEKQKGRDNNHEDISGATPVYFKNGRLMEKPGRMSAVSLRCKWSSRTRTADSKKWVNFGGGGRGRKIVKLFEFFRGFTHARHQS